MDMVMPDALLTTRKSLMLFAKSNAFLTIYAKLFIVQFSSNDL